MPKKYLITYDLDRPGQDYTDLLAYLRKLGATRVLESVWLLKSDLEHGALRDQIRSNGRVDTNDRILVVGLNGAGAWHNLMVNDAKVKELLT